MISKHHKSSKRERDSIIIEHTATKYKPYRKQYGGKQTAKKMEQAIKDLLHREKVVILCDMQRGIQPSG